MLEIWIVLKNIFISKIREGKARENIVYHSEHWLHARPKFPK